MVSFPFNEMKVLHDANKESTGMRSVMVPRGTHAGQSRACSVREIGERAAGDGALEADTERRIHTNTDSYISHGGEGGGHDYSTLVGCPGMLA